MLDPGTAVRTGTPEGAGAATAFAAGERVGPAQMPLQPFLYAGGPSGAAAGGWWLGWWAHTAGCMHGGNTPPRQLHVF